MAKAYSYIRFSSPEQARGDSHRRQRKMAEDYCRDHGLELAKAKEYTFFDEGRSAYTGEHVGDEGQLKRFFDLVDKGAIEPGSFLLVESLDRLSRDKVMVALNQFTGLLQKGIRIVTLTDKRVYSGDSTNIAMELIVSITVMMRAHEESATKGKRVREAWQNKRNLARSDKKPLGNACPYWLELAGGAYQQIPERVGVIRRIFEMTILGYGQALIAKRLNEDDVPVFGSVGENKRNKNGAWGKSSVAKILDNRAVLGEYQPMHLLDRIRTNDGEVVEGFYPAIIAPDVFLRAKAARAQRRTSKATKQSRTFNIWQGITKCRLCGQAMHLINKGQPPKGYTYLQCYGTKKGRCRNGSIRVEQTEVVFKEVLAKVDSLSLVQGRSAEILANLEVVTGRLGEVSAKLERANAAFKAFQSISAAQLLQTLEREKELYQSERETLRQQLASSQVISKEDFFNQLDLVSFEGRAAANSLLKRLEITIYFRRFNTSDFQCWVLDHSGEAESEDDERMLFSIKYTDGDITRQALDDDIWARQVQQGELDEDQVAREQEEGTGWQWFGGKLRSS
ncbi:recombinase family protein [Pseudomonas sp. R5(2019)]|uniref:recombinase family protein n=1 Tax=Pseudomonas sp. R5(2019) TaxID=2697566 RepID=UPI001412CEBB|nr:recombinase family protein [Pseudomonas sp. R5(2019)]NBA94376.1 recombinase family protein [Pseudomonas sp. R5(2019)]